RVVDADEVYRPGTILNEGQLYAPVRGVHRFGEIEGFLLGVDEVRKPALDIRRGSQHRILVGGHGLLIPRILNPDVPFDPAVVESWPVDLQADEAGEGVGIEDVAESRGPHALVGAADEAGLPRDRNARVQIRGCLTDSGALRCRGPLRRTDI